VLYEPADSSLPLEATFSATWRSKMSPLRQPSMRTALHWRRSARQHQSLHSEKLVSMASGQRILQKSGHWGPKEFSRLSQLASPEAGQPLGGQASYDYQGTPLCDQAHVKGGCVTTTLTSGRALRYATAMRSSSVFTLQMRVSTTEV
jgi:hypothetical protein